jgi:hypothetical protein
MSRFKLLAGGLSLALVLLSGCTHARQVSYDPGSPQSFEAVHQTLAGRRVDIRLHDQRTIASTALRIGPDSTWALDLLSGRVRGAATGEIHSISWKRPGRGVMEGAMLGAVGGTLVGLAAGLALRSTRDAERARTGVAQYVGVITGFGLLVGLGSGTLIGLRHGSYERYVYPPPSLGMADSPSPSLSTPAAPRR